MSATIAVDEDALGNRITEMPRLPLKLYQLARS